MFVFRTRALAAHGDVYRIVHPDHEKNEEKEVDVDPARTPLLDFLREKAADKRLKKGYATATGKLEGSQEFIFGFLVYESH